jgi:uncharacterized protein (TIGR03086 family)
MTLVSEPTAALDRAMCAVGKLVDCVDAGQWETPTPCTEWNVQELLDHLIAGNLRFAAVVRDASPPDPADVEPGDPAAYRSSTAALHAAFAEPGVLQRTFQAPIGPAPGGTLLQLRVIEQLVHGWDLALATGQPPALPEDLAEEALILAFAQFGGGEREGIPFGPAHRVTDDAPAIDKLAAFFGHRVSPIFPSRGGD